MSTTGISLLQSQNRALLGAQPITVTRCIPQQMRVGVACGRQPAPRARECNTPAGFRRGDGPQVARGDHAPSVARPGGDAARMLPGFDVSSR
jgi:hypothetical protein